MAESWLGLNPDRFVDAFIQLSPALLLGALFWFIRRSFNQIIHFWTDFSSERREWHERFVHLDECIDALKIEVRRLKEETVGRAKEEQELREDIAYLRGSLDKNK